MALISRVTHICLKITLFLFKCLGEPRKTALGPNELSQTSLIRMGEHLASLEEMQTNDKEHL